jgi:prophage antirepressor-like protein
VNLLDEDERKIIPVMDSRGRQQDSFIITEPGLYKLIMRSRKPEAKEFQRWVTHEVLPSIRKSGRYSVRPHTDSDELLGAVKDLVGLVRDLLADKIRPALPAVKPIASKDQISLLVRKYAVKNKLDYEWCWKELYREFLYRYHVNLLERAQNRNTTGVAIAEELDCINDLLALAIYLYGK